MVTSNSEEIRPSGLDSIHLLEAAALLLDPHSSVPLLLDVRNAHRCRILGSRCHERMYALGEESAVSEELVEVAWAGAQLFEALSELSADEPAWVGVCREQCCRYGVICLHQMLTDPASQIDPESFETLRERGLEMIARLKRLQTPPAAWLPPLEKKLESCRPQNNDTNGPLIVVVGNCQSKPIVLGLAQMFPQARLHLATPVHQATPVDVESLHGLLPGADILVTHRIQPGYRGGIGLDGETLSQLLPTTGRCIVLPNLHYEGYHPWIGYPFDPEGRLKPLEDDAPLGAYHDYLAMEVVGRGTDVVDLWQRPLSAAMAAVLQDWHATSLAQLQQRECDCDVRMADWIQGHHREVRLFHTFNHPSNLTLEALLERLVVEIAPDQDISRPDLGSRECLGASSHGIHPWVRQALALAPWSEAPGRRSHNTPWSAQEELQASIQFYLKHAEVGTACADRPKAHLSRSILDLSACGSDSLDPSTRPAPPPPCLTVLHPRQAFLASMTAHADPPDPPAWHAPVQIHPIGELVVEGAEVLPVGVVHGGCWYADSIQYLPQHWPQLAWLQNLSGYRLRSLPGGAIVLEEQAHPGEHRLHGSWCVLNDIVARRNIAHFFSDLLPQLVAIRRLRQVEPDLGVIASNGYLPNVERMLEMLLPDVQLERRPDGPPGTVPRLWVERLLLQPVAFNGGTGFFPGFEREWWLALAEFRDGLELLRQQLDALAPATPEALSGHWLCLHRDLQAPTEAPQGRFFSNYQLLLERLASAGVLVIDPGCHDVRHLYGLLRGARGIVGIHGAGLANSYLVPGSCKVIEIRPHTGTWGMLELMGRAINLHWTVCRSSPDPGDHDRSVLPVDTILEQVSADLESVH